MVKTLPPEVFQRRSLKLEVGVNGLRKIVKGLLALSGALPRVLASTFPRLLSKALPQTFVKDPWVRSADNQDAAGSAESGQQRALQEDGSTKPGRSSPKAIFLKAVHRDRAVHQCQAVLHWPSS